MKRKHSSQLIALFGVVLAFTAMARPAFGVDCATASLTYQQVGFDLATNEVVSAVSAIYDGDGSLSNFSVSPALPDGLQIDPTTGAFSGTAPSNAVPFSYYVITADATCGPKTTYLGIRIGMQQMTFGP